MDARTAAAEQAEADRHAQHPLVRLLNNRHVRQLVINFFGGHRVYPHIDLTIPLILLIFRPHPHDIRDFQPNYTPPPVVPVLPRHPPNTLFATRYNHRRVLYQLRSTISRVPAASTLSDNLALPSQRIITTLSGDGHHSSTPSASARGTHGGSSSSSTAPTDTGHLVPRSRGNGNGGGHHDDDDDDDDGRPPHSNVPADDVIVSTDSAAEIEEEIRQLDELLAGELPDDYRATFTQQRQVLLQTRADVLNTRHHLALTQHQIDELEREFQQKQAKAARLESDRQAAEQARMDPERVEAERQRKLQKRLQALAERSARSARLIAKTTSTLTTHN